MFPNARHAALLSTWALTVTACTSDDADGREDSRIVSDAGGSSQGSGPGRQIPNEQTTAASPPRSEPDTASSGSPAAATDTPHPNGTGGADSTPTNAAPSSDPGSGGASGTDEPAPSEISPEPAPPFDAGVGGSRAAAEPSSGGGVAPSGGVGGIPSVGGTCESRDFILCEDFEGTNVGEIPSGWERRGEEVRVTDAEAWRGSHSLELGAIPSWERRIAHDASALGGTHWGRIHYKVKLPVPDAFVHSTLVALTGDGPTRGHSEFRFVDTVKQAIDTPDVGSRHNFLFNVQPENSGEFGRETSYDYEFDGDWHCVEYHVDAANQSYTFYYEGEEKLAFEDGPGNYDRSDLPEQFDQIRVGWNNYQEAPPGFTAWIDDIAFDDERVGCDL